MFDIMLIYIFHRLNCYDEKSRIRSDFTESRRVVRDDNEANLKVISEHRR